MVFSRLRRCFSSKSSSSTVYHRLYTPPSPIADRVSALPNSAPPSPDLPIYSDDLHQTEPIPIGDGGSGNEEKTKAMCRIKEEEGGREWSFAPVGAVDVSGNKEKSSSMYRIENELRVMNKEAATHCSFGPVGDDIFRWEGVVIGPNCSFYEGGIFHLSIQFPSDYPLRPPDIKFLTKIFHPNVGSDGSIHIDILNGNWSSALTIEKLLLSICSILSNPIPPTSISEASTMYLNNWLNYTKIAREWTKLYAMPN